MGAKTSETTELPLETIDKQETTETKAFTRPTASRRKNKSECQKIIWSYAACIYNRMKEMRNKNKYFKSFEFRSYSISGGYIYIYVLLEFE